ncbi:MAG: hypothetical protein COV47_00710 [Candidatus Diapherotrites archaeon CG11_big_fil_rev_8_21_14_0_20_37_9]|nr:MAG: hypothetical protein COV47_00710 [Candidatus Diapherotrites archaeon CG11_big_fil_rev_8_21_14_0_20_37_9]
MFTLIHPTYAVYEKNKNIFKTNVSIFFMALKKDKQDKIKKALKETQSGLWVREISRKTGLDKSTVSRYMEKMGEEIDFYWIGRNKVFRLKGKE